MPQLSDTLKTYGAIASLAQVYRHNRATFDAQRHENVAEHSYALAVFGAALAHELNRTLADQLDTARVAQFAVVHDLTEAYMDEGDISVYAPAELLAAKAELEKKALQKLKAATQPYSWIVATIQAYERQDTPEARFVYALDKLIVHMNIILSNHHHAHPTPAKYAETEAVARAKITQTYPELLPYFEELCQVVRQTPHFFA